MDPRPPYNILFDKTFTLHRLSPLHYSPSSLLSSSSILNVHSRRFRDTLKGDSLRGVQVGSNYAEEGLARLGPFRSCQWFPFRTDKFLGHVHSREETIAGEGGNGSFAGIQVVVKYEKNVYAAIILQEAAVAMDTGVGEVHLPLLLIRMPAPLRDVFLEYLATTFDTRIETMRLSDTFVMESLEIFLGKLFERGEEHVGKVVKDLQVTLGFRPPVAPSLKNIDIKVNREDLKDFLDAGEAIMGRRQNGDNGKVQGTFLTALSQYIQNHMAIDINHEDVMVSRVACGGFVLSREGKVKISAPSAPVVGIDSSQTTPTPAQQAALALMGQLMARAKGDKIERQW